MIRSAAIVLLGVLAGGCGESWDAPQPPADLGDADRIADGRALYLDHCALCHGEDADGDGARSSNFSSPPRDFTQRGWTDDFPPERLYAVIHDGKQGTAMPAWNWLDDEQIWDLVAYLRSVPRDSG